LKMATRRTEELIQWDKEHVMHTLAPVQSEVYCLFESGKGAIIWDTEGKEYIDLGSQLTNVNLGHGREDIIEAAKSQMDKLQFANIFRGFSNSAAVECAQKLANIIPQGLDHFFFTVTGSDSVDAACRIAKVYWRALGKGTKYKIISLDNSYHGLFRGLSSATGLMGGMLEDFPSAQDHLRIPNYFCYRCPFHREHPGCDLECAEYVARTIEIQGKDNVAAFLVEPEQGSGGFISPPPEYWPRVREICSEYEVLLIADEVMTGFARTGKMFGVQNWDVVPDLMTISKGIVGGYLPMGVVAFSGHLWDGLKGVRPPIGCTEAGNPICCAVASKCIDIYLDEDIPAYVTSLGEHVRRRLETEFLPLPNVAHISGLGFMLGIELVNDKASKAPPSPEVTAQIMALGLEKGLYVRSMGNRVMYGPPLTISREDTDRSLDLLYSLIVDIGSKQKNVS
jgi:putrescine aminotransferase